MSAGHRDAPLACRVHRSPSRRTARRSLGIGLGAALLFGLATGCTTSRAVLAWQAGWRADLSGDNDVAIKHYADAYSRNGRLVGAELDRIRLLAHSPDMRETAEEALVALAKKKGARSDVAVFSAMWSLAKGDVRAAHQRLAALPRVDAPTKQCDEDERRLRRAWLAVRSAQGQWQQASVESANLAKRCGQAAVPADRAALVAWNGGHVEASAAWLARSRRHLPLLEALLARHGGDHQRLAGLLATNSSLSATERNVWLLLRAEAALRRDDLPRAEGFARRAIAAGSLAAQEILAIVFLRRGEAAQARDQLAGLVARSQAAVPWTVHFNQGVAEIRLGRWHDAQSAFARAAAACPTCPSPRRNLEGLRRLRP